MPNLDATQVRVAGTGAIWKAPAGSTLPTTSSEAWNSAFVNLGYAEEGFTVTPNFKTTPVHGWQTRQVLRNITTEFDVKFSFTLMQTNKATLSLAWGGATITPGTAGAFTLALPGDPAAEFVLGIDWSDGSTSYRYVIPRASLTNIPAVKFTRKDAIKYSFEVQALAPADGTDAVKIYGVDAAVGS